jgi:hypothetical protein
LEAEVVLRPEVAQEELVEGLFVGLADGVARDAVRHDFDDAANVEIGSGPVGNGVVGEEVEAQVVPFEDLQEQLDDLEGEAVLPDIIEHLEDARNLMFLRLVAVSALQYPTGHAIGVLFASGLAIAAAMGLKEVVDSAAHDGHVGHGLRHLLLRQVFIAVVVQALLPLLQLALLEVQVRTRIGYAVEDEQKGTLRGTLHGRTRLPVDA